ncbi:MAG: RNA-binding transcriptional accessory protein [Lachnospiraceae bacterium]|nr:RNA-binding transcriptional accessory protein [Lachnospiraceae bacterium]
MDIIKQLTTELDVRREQVEAAVKLIDEGNTIPFIARYRKEATGALNDEVLRNLDERLKYLRGLEEKKEQILKSIEEQGKLTDELKAQILEAQTMVLLEDLYRPYRPKRRTRATIAQEKGLQPLAEIIFAQDVTEPLESVAAAYVSEEKEVKSPEEAIAGACDIIAEMISDEADYRTYIRNLTAQEGIISSSTKDDKVESVYEKYYAFSETVRTLPGHRTLALNRGENEKILTVKIEAPVESILLYLEKKVITKDNKFTNDVLKATVADAYERLIAPSIEREVRNELTEKAEDGAIKVFGENLKQLLMQPPIVGQTVLGWDPGFRTGCKLAVVDATGKVLDTAVVFATIPGMHKMDEAKAIVKRLILKHKVTLISVGNGTASRESELFIVDLLKEMNVPTKYVITSEAGASVYSASKLATEEFPDYDVAQRSAVSIARRLQDPLAELVKIEPQAIGVGQYQHDMNQKKLSETLAGVVEDCVNSVGVDLNTASPALLEYVSGISKVIAKNIVAYREANGKFVTREDLLKVAKLGPKAFEQCAGFLRIMNGTNPLDSTSVHPESYKAATELLSNLGFTTEDITTLRAEQLKEARTRKAEEKAAKEAAMPNKGERKKKEERPKEIRAYNTNSAFGAAFAQAMAKSGKPMMQAAPEKKEEKAVAPVAVKAEGDSLSSIGKLIKDKKKLAEELGIGEMTLTDIIKELEKPGRDPRDEMPKPILRSDVLGMEDLKEGMILKGTVRNVIDFGVFVDIGVHQDGLVHISQITNKKYIKHPLEAVSVGDIVDVKVLSCDVQKKRIQLSMIM